MRKSIREWSPGRFFIGTGDPDTPHLIDEFLLPKVWERATEQTHPAEHAKRISYASFECSVRAR